MTSFTRIIAAAAIAAGLFAGPAFAGSTAPSQDSVNIVPASAPAPDSAVENGFKRGKIVSYNSQAAGRFDHHQYQGKPAVLHPW